MPFWPQNVVVTPEVFLGILGKVSVKYLPAEVIDLTGGGGAYGELEWKVPEGQTWYIYKVGMVKSGVLADDWWSITLYVDGKPIETVGSFSREFDIPLVNAFSGFRAQYSVKIIYRVGINFQGFITPDVRVLTIGKGTEQKLIDQFTEIWNNITSGGP